MVAAGDALDPSWHMTPGTDGTPNESVYDVLVSLRPFIPLPAWHCCAAAWLTRPSVPLHQVRMRQLLSVTETQYYGETVIIISPDSDCLSILQVLRHTVQDCGLPEDMQEHNKNGPKVRLITDPGCRRQQRWAPTCASTGNLRRSQAKCGYCRLVQRSEMTLPCPSPARAPRPVCEPCAWRQHRSCGICI